jgi:signal transduction histidine kinase
MSALDARFRRNRRQAICTLRLLVLTALSMLGLAQHVASPLLYWALVTAYAATILVYLRTPQREYERRNVKFAVFLLDVLLVSSLIIVRGHDVSGFLIAYFGLVLMAAIIEGLGNAIFNAVLVSVLYAALTRWGSPIDQLLDAQVLTQFGFFLVIAVFMGHVATGAREEAADRERAQRQLAAQSSVLAESTQALKVAREALRASDRLATLGMLSAGLAHEIRTPLAAIRSSLEPAEEILDELVEALRAGQEGESQRTELVEIVRDSVAACSHLGRVARDLTALARGSASKPVPVDPGTSLQIAVRMLRPRVADGVRVEVDVGSRRRLLADPGRLLQVILNLAGNALDALRENGGGTLRLAVEECGDRVALCVEDDGPGMSEELRARVFQPFVTTKPAGRGTGLGLHVVDEIVKAHRGTIELDTEPGRGTRFRVEFPAAPGDLPSENRHEPASQDPPDRGRRGDHPPGAGSDAAQGAVRAPARA